MRRLWPIAVLVLCLMLPASPGLALPVEGYCDEEGNPVVTKWPESGSEGLTPYCVSGIFGVEMQDHEVYPARGDFEYPKPGDWAGWAFVNLNGKAVTNPYGDVTPYVSSTTGRTLIPIRFVSEAMGADVKWDDATQAVTINWSSRTIKLTIGSRAAQINGRTASLDQPAILFADRTFVPLRFVAEAFGARVEWDESSWIASVYLEGVDCDPRYCPYD